MFDKEAHIKKMQSHVNKLTTHFKNKGIDFTPTDGEFDNVIFKSKNKEVKISHHSFYRFSGICVIYVKTGDQSFQISEITDEMFLNNYMKPIIESLFSEK